MNDCCTISCFCTLCFKRFWWPRNNKDPVALVPAFTLRPLHTRTIRSVSWGSSVVVVVVVDVVVVEWRWETVVCWCFVYLPSLFRFFYHQNYMFLSFCYHQHHQLLWHFSNRYLLLLSSSRSSSAAAVALIIIYNFYYHCKPISVITSWFNFIVSLVIVLIIIFIRQNRILRWQHKSGVIVTSFNTT